MRLYKLERLKGLDQYDIHLGFVIRAKSPKHARLIAAEDDQTDAKIWLSKETSSCELLIEEGEAGIILESFAAG